MGDPTPLLVVLAFILLTEVVVIAGVLGTSGVTQVLLALFCIAFPPGIAAAFFVVLWNRPWVLYSPRSFGDNDPAQFVKALSLISTQAERFIDNLEDRVGRAVADAGILDVSPETTKKVAEQLRKELRKEDAITIDLSEFGGGKAIIPAYLNMQVGDLLDFLYFEICKTYDLETFSYTKNWVLYGPSSKKTFNKMGTIWARKRGLPRDERALAELGIGAGTELIARNLAK